MGEPVAVAGGHSERGRRDNNEDAFSLRTDLGVFVVADGMGGLASGEVASQMAVSSIPEKVIDRLAHHDRPDEALRTAIECASQAILSLSAEERENSRMGTTAVVALLRPGRVFIANLGDSPAYLVRGERVIRLTLDHTVAEELVRKGALTPDQARRSPLRNRLYKYLGSADLKELADVHDFPPRSGDRLVLLSDGASGLLTDEEIAEIAGTPADPDILAKAFVDRALEKGSNDNATCVVVAFEPDEVTSPPA